MAYDVITNFDRPFNAPREAPDRQARFFVAIARGTLHNHVEWSYDPVILIDLFKERELTFDLWVIPGRFKGLAVLGVIPQNEGAQPLVRYLAPK